MKLVFVCLWFLCAMAVWRRFTQRGAPCWRQTQTALHSLPHAAGFLQWYVVLFVGISLLMVLTYYYNAVLLKADWLSPNMPTWLRRLSKASLVAGALAFALIILHFAHDVRCGRSFRVRKGQEFPWAPSKRQDMVLNVIAVPAIYVVMSVQSTARMWMVIDKEYGNYGEEVDLALYQENLALAAICQYYVVFVFSFLSFEFVKERASAETKNIIKLAGFQGVHAWVVVGILRSVLDFSMAYASAHYADVVAVHEAQLTAFRAKLNDGFTFLTLLCVYNMFLICRFDALKDALGNANLKFLGTRLLLLVGQIQPEVCSLTPVMQFLGLNAHTAQLLHSSLVTCECLLVALFNFFAWEFGVKKELLYDARNLAERRAAGEEGGAEPLLG